MRKPNEITKELREDLIIKEIISRIFRYKMDIDYIANKYDLLNNEKAVSSIENLKYRCVEEIKHFYKIKKVKYYNSFIGFKDIKLDFDNLKNVK